jgi:hypothetical protein
MTLEETLANADAAHRKIWEAFAGDVTSLGPMTPILLSYASLALEHHEAITILVRKELFGSALALARPVFEIMWRSGWVRAIASPEQIAQVLADTIRFPDARTMVKALDEAYDTGRFFQGIHDNSWKSLNSYTHSGKLQLLSRFSKGTLEPSYSDDEKIMVVNSTLVAAGMTAILVLKAHNRMENAAAVEQILLALHVEPPSNIGRSPAKAQSL